MGRGRQLAAACLALALGGGPAAGWCASAGPARASGAAAPRPAATAAAARGRAAAASDPVAALESEVEQFLREREEANWDTWSNGAGSRQAEIYSRHPHLFTRETLARVRAAVARARAPQDKKALTYLRRFLEGEFVSQQAAVLEDSIANVMLSATVAVDTGRVPYFQISGWLSNQPDHARRLAAYAAQDSVLDALKPLYQARLELVRREAARLGYPSRFHFYQDQKGISFPELEREVRAFLSDTQGMYDTLLILLARDQLALPAAEVRRADINRINRLRGFDEYFPRDQLLPSLTRSFADLGVDLSRQRNIRLDVEDRPGKNPRAACFAVHVPDDIRVSVEPVGGLQDYEAVFHEMGHAEHAAYTRQARIELRSLGSSAFGECMAFAHEYLLEDPGWLATHLQVERYDLQHLAPQAAGLRLMLVRRYAGKFLYQMDLHRGGVKPEDAYLSNMRLALRYPMDEHDARRCYEDDEGFYEADYLQAWFLEAMLVAHLEARYGPRYFQRREAGEELKALWATGQELSGPELARRLGATHVDHRPLAAQLRAAIEGPVRAEGD